MHPLNTNGTLRRERGMSLIELLVGMVIGVIALLAIFQAVVVWDKHMQTTASGSDAQTAGTLAIFNIERDLKHAGFGFGTADLLDMGCTVQAADTTPARTFSFPMNPVDIVVGAGGVPDQINVLYGNSSFFVTTEKFTAATATTKRLVRRNGFKAGDLAVVAGNASGPASANCQLIEVTDTSDVDGFTISHDITNYASFYGAASAVPRFNTAAGTGTTFSSGEIYNLGPAPQRNSWSIGNSRTLTRTDLIHNTPAFEIADGVVNLKAQYGVDSDANGQIADSEWTTTTPTDWTKVLAIRIAVLVRSRQFERSGDAGASAPSPVTPSSAPPTWSGGASAPFLMANVDGSADSYADTDADPNNWRYYRYRVYERVIPLRNMLWGSLP